MPRITVLAVIMSPCHCMCAFMCACECITGCDRFTPASMTMLLMFLVFESLLFGLFAAIMCLTQLCAIASDHTVRTRHITCWHCRIVCNNNNNNNSHDNDYGAVIMTKVIVRVHPVHLMNVD